MQRMSQQLLFPCFSILCLFIVMTIVVCSSLYASEVASHAMSRGKMDMVFENVKFLDGKYDPRRGVGGDFASKPHRGWNLTGEERGYIFA